jgi:predicted amidohydrolase YtcJ
MYWAGERLGKERLKKKMLIKLLNKAGVIALGTDFPVEEVNNVDFHAALPERIAKGILVLVFRWKMH